jgi:hypothetical protein
MTACKTCGESDIGTFTCAGSGLEVTRNEAFWLEVIREASRDTDPSPTLRRVQKLRAIFRDGGTASFEAAGRAQDGRN